MGLKSTAILYWFCKKKKCFVTIKIIFWLNVHNYFIVFPVETVSSSKIQYVIWFILLSFWNLQIYWHQRGPFWSLMVLSLIYFFRFIAHKLKGSNMAWILFKETLLVPYFYMQKLLLGGNIFLDNVSVDSEKEGKVKQIQKM